LFAMGGGKIKIPGAQRPAFFYATPTGITADGA
jgi:hypothetical protein